MKTLILLIFILFQWNLYAGSNLRIIEDISYQKAKGWDPNLNKLDLYLGHRFKEKGIIVFVHGGGWIKGDKKSYPKLKNFARYFLTQGYAVASINYRLSLNSRSPNTSFEDQANDISLAIKFLVKNADKYKFRNNIILFGHSAGAHLVALVGTDKQYLKKAEVAYSKLKAIISSDVHNYNIPWALSKMRGSHFQRNIPFIKRLFGTTLSRQLQASPEYHITKNTSPIAPIFLMSSGYTSSGFSFENIPNLAQENFKNKLRHYGHRAIHKHYPKDSHKTLLLGFGENGDPQTRDIHEFLKNVHVSARN